jgi:hypothetical protein
MGLVSVINSHDLESNALDSRALTLKLYVIMSLRYHTFSALAGVDATDHRAALANLPPIDSFDHSGLILGTTLVSPRTELPIGTEPRASNLTNAPLCNSYMQTEYYGDVRLGGADKAPPPPTSGRCTTVAGLIVDEGTAGLWKLLTGAQPTLCSLIFVLSSSWHR